MIVTIDGPAGSGKSTAARGLAERIGFQFLDTGAMYRVVGLCCLQQEVDPSDPESAAGIALGVDISFCDDRVLADGVDVTDEIRSLDVTQAASIVAANPHVRGALVELQRELAAGRNIVCEGRDQGTVVFPDARCKFFLTADPRERARRRHSELAVQGIESSVEEILEQLRARDRRDADRLIAPLKPADDAVRIDTSSLTADEVIALLEQTVRAADI